MAEATSFYTVHMSIVFSIFFLTHKIEKILRQHEYETKQQQTITNKTRSYLREMQFGMS